MSKKYCKGWTITCKPAEDTLEPRVEALEKTVQEMVEGIDRAFADMEALIENMSNPVLTLFGMLATNTGNWAYLMPDINISGSEQAFQYAVMEEAIQNGYVIQLSVDMTTAPFEGDTAPRRIFELAKVENGEYFFENRDYNLNEVYVATSRPSQNDNGYFLLGVDRHIVEFHKDIPVV